MGRAILGILAAFAVAISAVIAAPAAPASALSGSEFDPGYIIDDSKFYDGNAMSESQIQSFLGARIAEYGGCLTSQCLANYIQNTTSKPADIRTNSSFGTQVICNAYQGGFDSAARIIFKVQQACGISARVLLVTLQKEQSLLTTRAPSSWQMQAATGWGCPDSSPGVCDASYYGFFNQVWRAAWQLKRYSTPSWDVFGNYQPGTKYIQYNPNPDCGGSWVNIRNNATAALYNYTPYQPNWESLNNLRGDGGPCGAHGNRNFWVYYNDWFGSTTSTISGLPAPTRLQGANRFETSAAISQQIPLGTGTVFIANGMDFPDALAAAPAATVAGAPMLLVRPELIPPAITAELSRIKPTRIVVVGSEASVSAAVFDQLTAVAPTVRVGGANRYATSRELLQFYPRQSASEAYVVTGLGFADALAAGAAAGSKDAPILLVNGLDGTIDVPTADALESLGVTKVTIVGSPVSVSSGIETSIKNLGITVNRLGGSNRYNTATLVAKDAFPTSSTVYLAHAQNFPDALAGAALAGAQSAPVLLAPSTCLYRGTAQEVMRLGASKLVLLGGEAGLGAGVARYYACD